MNKKVIIKPSGDEEIVKHLQEVLDINNTLASLLTQRGIKTFDEAKAFFRPEIEKLHDPFLMTDMNKAVERLNEAVSKSERILIYGDYDVDGTTSVALVYSFLRNYSENIDFYIPDRYSEGYGISYKGIDYAADNNFSLVIALDCGIKAVEKIDYANQKNIDFIICDHHTPGEKIPDAYAVLDPKREDCNYPDKNLSGCGVGFKFLQAYSNRNQIEFKELEKYIDLVVVSIASDIVPVIGENRILAYYGLIKLNKNPLKGLEVIKRISGVRDNEMSISDCVFKIGPRINAAGRIKSGNDAVRLLISENSNLANEIAQKIDVYNTERKNLDRDITHEALRKIGNCVDLKNRKSTVLYDKDWHKGVVGIVASRLTETYYRPTVVLTESNGMATGSARSVSDFNIYDAINSCSDLLESFGGHKFAAGLTLKLENIEKFSDCIEKYVTENITPEQLIPQVNVDAELRFSEIDRKFYNIMRQMAPFGPGNMSPVFITKGVSDTGTSKKVGSNKEHLKLEVVDTNGVVMSGIAFSLAPDYFEPISNKEKFSICYSIDKNEFRGVTSLQLRVKEIILE
ncbi:MAG: single-stranded-DNA-specific exonuclease RecJ [Bacteroidales bacterium]|nr:single-stranded-DNA-specific exonuclease RecJ [Bacteroidales bacterium]